MLSVWKTKTSNDSAIGNKSSCRKRELGETKYVQEAKRSRSVQRMTSSGHFHSKRLWERFKRPRLFLSLVLDHMSIKTKSDTEAVFPTYI